MAAPQPKRITELDLANPLTDADLIAVVQNNRTKKATLAQIQSVTDTSCECSPVSRFSQLGNAANTSRQYLHTWQMPPDFLPTAGSWIDIDISGQFAANTDTKIIYLQFGSSNIISGVQFTGSDGNSKFFKLRAKVTRATSTTQTMTGSIIAMPRAGLPAAPVALGFKASGGENLANSVNVQLSVETDTATANNILIDDFHVVVHYLDANS